MQHISWFIVGLVFLALSSEDYRWRHTSAAPVKPYEPALEFVGVQYRITDKHTSGRFWMYAWQMTVQNKGHLGVHTFIKYTVHIPPYADTFK
jgi:hypothetical protein